MSGGRSLRAVLYARVSTDTGQQDPEVQLLALRKMCADRGWRIGTEHHDRVTGDPARRGGDPPGLRAALDAIQRGKADVLCIFAADRLVRSPVGLLQLIDRVQGCGGKITSYSDGRDLDTTTPEGELSAFLHGWFARFAMRLGRERTIAGLQRARAAGKSLGRPRAPEPCPAEVWARRDSGTERIALQIGSSRHVIRAVLGRLRRHNDQHGTPWPASEVHELNGCRQCLGLVKNGGSEGTDRPEENGGSDRGW